MAEDGVMPANHCRIASFCGCQVEPFNTRGNCALGSPSITSPVSSLFWQLPLGESHHGTALLTKGSLKVSAISWLSALIWPKVGSRQMARVIQAVLLST